MEKEYEAVLDKLNTDLGNTAEYYYVREDESILDGRFTAKQLRLIADAMDKLAVITEGD
jgi:hypothetical protein